jgi:hypothetical protein
MGFMAVDLKVLSQLSHNALSWVAFRVSDGGVFALDTQFS